MKHLLNQIPKDVDEHFIIRIAYPWKNFGAQFAMMLSTVISNILVLVSQTLIWNSLRVSCPI